MDEIYLEYKDKNVLFFTVYGREPHAGQNMERRNSRRNADRINSMTKSRNTSGMQLDFTDKKQTRDTEERKEYAEILITDHKLKRPILIDTVGRESLQFILGGGAPNSLTIIGKSMKLEYWVRWSDPEALKVKLDELTKNK